MNSSNQTLIEFNGINYTIPEIFYGGTILNASDCTPSKCSLLAGTYTYLPSIPGNAFFAAVFGLLLLVNIPLGIYYRTWGVLASMVMGLGLESAAYIARIMIHRFDFSRNVFIIYIYCITLGATFLSAAIYLCLARIVVVYGEGYSRLKPRTYSLLFLFGDFIALSLQGAGGGMVQVEEVQDIGLRVLIAGLGFQVDSLVTFGLMCINFSWRVHRGKGEHNPLFHDLVSSRRWTGFLLALMTATVGIILRCSYRIAELHAGFHSQLFNDQTLFMFLEGTVMSIVAIALTVFHPGLVFRRQWRDSNYRFRLWRQERLASLSQVQLQNMKR